MSKLGGEICCRPTDDSRKLFKDYQYDYSVLLSTWYLPSFEMIFLALYGEMKKYFSCSTFQLSRWRHMLTISPFRLTMRIGQKMCIFYLWPIFQLVLFFIPQFLPYGYLLVVDFPMLNSTDFPTQKVDGNDERQLICDMIF